MGMALGLPQPNVAGAAIAAADQSTSQRQRNERSKPEIQRVFRITTLPAKRAGSAGKAAQSDMSPPPATSR